MDFLSLFSERYTLASATQTIGCYLFTLGRFMYFFEASTVFGALLSLVGAISWTTGGVIFSRDYAQSARQRSVSPSNDRSTVANVLFSIAGVLLAFSSVLMFSRASQDAGVAFSLLGCVTLMVGGVVILLDAIALAEGWLILEDKYTLTGFLFAVGAGFGVFGSLLMFGDESYEPGVAAFWISGILMAVGSTLFTLEMRSLSVVDVSQPLAGQAVGGGSGDAYESLDAQAGPSPASYSTDAPPAGGEWDQQVSGWKDEGA